MEAQQEEPQDLEITVPVDKLLQPDPGTLHQEFGHLAVILRVPQPIGEILLRNSVFGTPCLLQRHDRCRRIKAQPCHDEIHDNGKQQKRKGPGQQHPVRGPAEKGQQQSQTGIQHEDIAAPQKHQMQKADQQQNRHAPVENSKSAGSALLRMVDDDREADTEQQRKQRVELAVDEDQLQVAHDTVDPGRRQGSGRIGRKEGVQRKLGEVGQRNTQQRQTRMACRSDERTGRAACIVSDVEVMNRVEMVCTSCKVPHFGVYFL